MREITFKQFMLWYAQAMRIQHGIEIKLKDPDAINDLDWINDNFIWNKEKKRWE